MMYVQVNLKKIIWLYDVFQMYSRYHITLKTADTASGLQLPSEKMWMDDLGFFKIGSYRPVASADSEAAMVRYRQ